MTLKTLPVDANGTVLAFTDSGKPDSDTYITIFAVHGIGFNNFIFKRVAAKAASKISTRVASSPVAAFSWETLSTPSSRRTIYPPISAGVKTGGVAVLGWSAGGLLSCAVITNIDSLSPTAKDRFKLYLRSISCKALDIYSEPPSISLGLPLPASNWSPHTTPTIPADKHPAMFTSDVSVLSYHIAETADQRPVELPGMFMSMAQANATYRKACYSADVKALVPSLKTTFFTGDRSASYSLAALWSIEDDNNLKAEGGNLKFVVVPGANHFPLKVYVDVLEL
ncbi:hypothetical protein B0H14DRAFT_2893140, partial [Mycena olivaceomarginata]